MEDDDDIEWPENPFDRPHRAEPESPDELLAMIQFEGTPALQQALRALCRGFIYIYSTAVRPLPAKVMSMVIDIDRSKWEIPSNRLPRRHHSAENTVVAGLVYQICELYIDDVLIHGRDLETFLANRKGTAMETLPTG
jgi:hypothetical protein